MEEQGVEYWIKRANYTKKLIYQKLERVDKPNTLTIDKTSNISEVHYIVKSVRNIESDIVVEINCTINLHAKNFDSRFTQTDKFDYNFGDEAFIDLSTYIFKGELNITRCELSQTFDFSNSHFENYVSFKDIYFRNNCRFHNAVFIKPVDFENTTFNKLVDFYFVEFKSAQQFHLTDFFDRAIFSNVIFHDQIQFKYNKVKNESVISFESAKFYEGLDISRSNFWCKLQFQNALFTNIIPSKYGLYGTDKWESENNSYAIVLNRLRESFRIIKNCFKTANTIDALKYQQKEMLVF